MTERITLSQDFVSRVTSDPRGDDVSVIGARPTDAPIVTFRGKYFFLSNFHPAIIRFDEVWYPTVEHAYQAAKTLQIRERVAIWQARTAAQAKRLGKTVTVRPDWDLLKLEIMELLLQRKFEERGLMYALATTGSAELIEGNNWGDTFWGVCNGVGENHLGKLLMKIRAEQAIQK